MHCSAHSNTPFDAMLPLPGVDAFMFGYSSARPRDVDALARLAKKHFAELIACDDGEGYRHCFAVEGGILRAGFDAIELMLAASNAGLLQLTAV